MDQQDYYLYLWKNPYTGMTCYGVTGNLVSRQSKYQGHCGFDIEFSFILKSNKSIITELEDELKLCIKKLGLGYRDYEWISSEVDYETVEETVLSLLGDKPGTVLSKER